MKQYIITILKNGKTFDEIIFKANNDEEALEYIANIFTQYERKYTMHLALYYGNGRKGTIISSIDKNIF